MYSGQTKTNPQGTLAQSILLTQNYEDTRVFNKIKSVFWTLYLKITIQRAIETGPTPPSKACFKRLRLVRLGLQCNPPALNHQREKSISIFWIGIHCYLGLFCIFCSILIAKVFVPLYIHHNKTKFWILVFFHFTFICPLIKGQIKINKGKISKYIL